MKKNSTSWVICLLEAGSGRRVLVTEGMEIEADDPTYERDVHILPWHNPDGIFPFGAHVFDRTCYCRPEIQERGRGRTLIVHSARVN